MLVVCKRRNAPVHARALSLAVPAADDHQVQRVTTALSFEVILARTKFSSSSSHLYYTKCAPS